jgi:hypothetical protein
VALSLLYQFLCRMLGLVRARRRDAFGKDAEILVLRHQLAVLRRLVGRPRFSWSDRALIALLASFVPRERWHSFLVTPQTVLDWHRRLVRQRWTYSHRRPGRPRLADETVELIWRLARENPRWVKGTRISIRALSWRSATLPVNIGRWPSLSCTSGSAVS